MFSLRFVVPGALLGFWFAASYAQQTPTPSPHPALHEFPLTLQENIESGKAKIGTKVQAKLAMATMFHGMIIPRNAVFSGLVIESDAKSAKAPAKLAIRMETAEWKDGSTSLTAYLLPLSYATTAPAVQGLRNESQDPDSRTLSEGQSESPMQRSFPNNDSQAAQAAIPEIPTASNRPVPMKNVVIARADEGGAALVSDRGNIKLNKMTTYVFAAIEPVTK
ncbi:MAG: hypothetical protein ACHP8A_10040 [Terriglobales bacterium]|jgi:hypothetical protein|nr:hypothetical protein [Terriglobales bacterium]